MRLNLKMLGAAALVAGGMGLGSAAYAAPGTPVSGFAANDLIEHVAQGCGRGFARDRRGFCRPMRAYGPPRAYGPRRCWVDRTPWGPRRVCR